MALNKTDIRFEPGFYILLCIMILLVPIKWLASWFLAVLVHELFHYVAILILKYNISYVCFSLTGVYMGTGDMTTAHELVVSFAGPMGSVLLVLFSKYMPMVSVCALLQSVYNLIPVYPFDGGRILRNLIILILRNKNVDRVVVLVEKVVLSVLVVVSVSITVKYSLGLFPFVLLIPIFLKRDY